MSETNLLFEHDKKLFEQWRSSEYYNEKIKQRVKVVDACNRANDARVITKQLCKEDPIFFIEMFGWTYDPRPQHSPNNLPFILFDYQKDVIFWLVKHIKEGEDGLIEKSRDMGVTWIAMWTFYWMWLFSDSFSALVGSYKESLVDNRTRDSMFGMLDYCIENTPKWMLPKRFKFKDNRQKLKLINPETFNIISGDTMNPDFSRGSRKSVVFMDEGASWEYFRDAWEAAGDTTPCRLTCSTPKGRNQFSLLRDSNIGVNTIHWSLHPLKDKEWYEYQKIRRTNEEIAQELDISYHRSQEGRVYPEWDEVQWGKYPYDDSLPLYVSWDFGQTDDTALIWFQEDEERKVRIIDAYANRGKTIDFYIPFVTGAMPAEYSMYSKRDYDIIQSHMGWRAAMHFGDPAGRNVNQVTNKSVLDVLKDYGIHVNFRKEAQDFQTRKTETKLLLKKLTVNDIENVKELSVAIENASYPMVRSGGAEEVRSIKPAHNWTSHYRSSLEYFAVNYNYLRRRTYAVKDKFPKRENRNRAVGY